MAFLKLNIFHWHLVDDQGWRIEIEKYPELVNIGSVREKTQKYFRSKEFFNEIHQGHYT